LSNQDVGMMISDQIDGLIKGLVIRTALLLLMHRPTIITERFTIITEYLAIVTGRITI
jgi:hypothetical protein